MSQMNLNLTLSFRNAGGSAAQAALHAVAQSANQSSAALNAIAQSATQTASGLGALNTSVVSSARAHSISARAASASSTALGTVTHNANQAATSLAALNTSAVTSARAHGINTRAATQSATSLRQLSASARQNNTQLQQASANLLALTAAARQATTAQIALAAATNQSANQQARQQTNPFASWLPQALRDSKLLAATWTGMKIAGAAIGAGMAAKAAVATPFNNVMAYDLRLAHAANTAYADKNLAGRQAGSREMNTAVMTAARVGGGTRENALDAAEALLASGNVGNAKDVYKLLPGIIKAATAGNAKATEIANIAGVAVKTGGIPVGQINKTLGMALYAGQVGGFELKDMAKWLPQHIAMGKSAGISGQDGVAKMLALSEMAINSAGTKDEAGNNVRDFLHELSSQTTATHMKKFSFNKKTGYLEENEGHGHKKNNNYVDLGHTLAEHQSKGIDSIDSIIKIVRLIAESDPKFREAKAKMAEAKAKGDNAAQVEITEKVHNMLMGRGVGKLFHNQQSLMGGINAMMNPEEYHKLTQDIATKGGQNTIDTNHEAIAATASYKMEQKANEEANALQTGLAGATGMLGKYADSVADLYKKNPVLAASIETMTVAVKAATAAISVFAGAALVGRALGGAGAVTTAGAAGAAAATAGRGLLALGAIAAAKVGAAGAAGYAVGHYVVAPAIDGAVSLGTGKKDNNLGNWLYDVFNDSSHDKLMAGLDPAAMAKKHADAQAQARAFTDPLALYPQLTTPNAGRGGYDQFLQAQQAPQQAPIQITTQLNLDGHQLATILNQVNGREAARH